MKKKRNQCYLLLGSILMLVLACVCFFTFVKSNLNQAAKKDEFESIYENTAFDYIVPAPSNDQMQELETTNGNGISVVVPYYETNAPIGINGKTINGTTILFPFAEKMTNTPYAASRIVKGKEAFIGGEAIADQAYIERTGCAINDKITITIADHEYVFTLTSISETNTYYNNGTIALVLTKTDAEEIESKGIKYSAAFISASDLVACKSYLYSEYKPLSRLKDKSEFDSEDTYNQHLKNFNNADWSKEITNCQDNYKTLSVKYDNVNAGIWTNITIMSFVIAFTIIVFNSVLLTKGSMKNYIKAFLVKKSGTKDTVKKFYRSGITANAIAFCIASICLYVLLAYQTHTQLVNLQIMNCIIPIVVAVIVSAVMAGISSSYVEKHYRIKILKRKDSSEEVQVEVI